MTTSQTLLLAFLGATLFPQLGKSADEACRALSGREIGGARVLNSIPVATDWKLSLAGYTVSTDSAFCRVNARVDAAINIELWLPDDSAWNGRLLGAGVGGSAGTFDYRGLARGIDRGFAVASTDTGHTLDQKDWMLDPQAADNYAHRAVHVMTIASKAIISAYYSHAASKAYFTGCSGGGREGLKEMQLYPQDYDGILAGAPGSNMPLLSVRHMLTAILQQRSAAKLDAADWELVSRRFTQSCDQIDGVRDGVVQDPRRCHFDVATLACSAGQISTCLSDEKIALIRQIAAPIHDENGVQLDGGLLPGVSARPGPPPSLLLELFGQGVHNDLNWDPQSFSPAKDLAAVYVKLPEFRADAADLHSFQALGHKAILYQGWMDPSVTAPATVSYYDSVTAAMGGVKATQKFLRLFMVPGMLHCAGGNSTDQFGGSAGSAALDSEHDALSALIKWVEMGAPPSQLIASRVINNSVVRTQPLCPFPASARYVGAGDTREASNYRCTLPPNKAVP